MRTPILLAATVLGIAAAEAQMSSYYAERGHWTVYSGPKFCRAFNRPAAEFNYAPYDALQIAVGAKGSIAVEVFFWPGAVMAEREYKLKLVFSMRDPMVLPARATMDFMVAAEPDMALWRALQDTTSLEVRTVDGEQPLALYFDLGDIKWVLDALTVCQRVLPKE